MNKKLISISTGCYNESGNLRELYARVRDEMSRHPQYDWELLIADNHSTDGSRELLREMAREDKRLKVILNSNNFGHIRSPMNMHLQARGDAVVIIVSDLQEPPELIGKFLELWEQGHKVICGVKPRSRENPLMFRLRRIYYRLLAKFSEVRQIENFTGFGLYDRQFMVALKRFHEPYPYFRGLVGEIGFDPVEVPFVQERRKRGKTKNNFFTLYDMAMTGFVNHTKLPLRMAVFFGLTVGFLSMLIAMGYLLMKLIYWDEFSFGMAPLMIGMFFFASVQLIFIGILGEYIGAVWTQVKDRPLAIEEERINFAPEGEKEHTPADPETMP